MTYRDKLIEAAAEAAWQAHHTHDEYGMQTDGSAHAHVWPDDSSVYWTADHYRACATAALDAILSVLKEPSEEMKMAGAEAITLESMKAKANYCAMLDCWQAMIDKVGR